ncbi:MAG: NAD-dependent epimerase/dehydratase family protein [Candidatus Aenigmarchaeota archaeon]|nr:NAD-dependent epimerase/dehydratase family protein [Candidatus Aenigmarchaeota archaeon]
MRCLVTGCAGFIGSHLSEKLIESGFEVIGIDSFTDYYDRRIKEANVQGLRQSTNFTLVREDVLGVEWDKLLEGVDYVFHHAAQPGVLASWGTRFEAYINNNILATQRLLEATKKLPLKSLIFASSSSVYGDCKLPMREDRPLCPVSPYGVSKLACESLCYSYWKNFGIPVVSLRYFTVYGPRQRPDMAFHKFIRAILQGEEITIYGDGNQTRDFTYIEDVVKANFLIMDKDCSGEVINIGGGIHTKINEITALLQKLMGKKARIRHINPQKGDMRDTLADIGKAKKLLNYNPRFDLTEGLKREIEWLKEIAKL